jgi:hypothetical protein
MQNMKVSKDIFFECQAKLDRIAFTQTEEWYKSCGYEKNYQVDFFVNDVHNVKIACWGVITTSKLLGRKLILNGISSNKNLSEKEYNHFFSSLLDVGYDIIDISDIDEYNVDFEVGIRRAGFTRPIGISLCPLSIIVDIEEKKYSFHRNWRRQVQKSKDAGDQFMVVTNPSMRDLEKFVSLFNALKKRKSLKFSLSKEELAELFKSDKYKLFFVKNKDGKEVCGRIEFIHKGLVYDVYAANSNEALASGAVYHIQEEIFNSCSDMGGVYFDYGRVSPSADHMDNIYVSKSYSGGHVVQYNGQWHYAASKFKDALYSFYRYGMRKTKNY